MRVPRVRFTMRWLLIAVAVVAIALGAEARRRRASSLAQRYATKGSLCFVLAAVNERVAFNDPEHFASAASLLNRTIQQIEAKTIEVEPALASAIRRLVPVQPIDPSEIAWHRRLSVHYKALYEKYERAWQYPFLPLAPDPPEPE